LFLLARADIHDQIDNALRRKRQFEPIPAAFEVSSRFYHHADADFGMVEANWNFVRRLKTLAGSYPESIVNLSCVGFVHNERLPNVWVSAKFWEYGACYDISLAFPSCRPYASGGCHSWLQAGADDTGSLVRRSRDAVVAGLSG
jgi:hypothetical protein